MTRNTKEQKNTHTAQIIIATETPIFDSRMVRMTPGKSGSSSSVIDDAAVVDPPAAAAAAAADGAGGTATVARPLLVTGAPAPPALEDAISLLSHVGVFGSAMAISSKKGENNQTTLFF
jgi:hypothetical protein